MSPVYNVDSEIRKMKKKIYKKESRRIYKQNSVLEIIIALFKVLASVKRLYHFKSL